MFWGSSVGLGVSVASGGGGEAESSFTLSIRDLMACIAIFSGRGLQGSRLGGWQLSGRGQGRGAGMGEGWSGRDQRRNAKWEFMNIGVED